MARDDAFDAIVLYSPLCSIQPSASLCVSPIWFHTFAGSFIPRPLRSFCSCVFCSSVLFSSPATAFCNFSLQFFSILVATSAQNRELAVSERTKEQIRQRLEIATVLNSCVGKLNSDTDIDVGINNLLATVNGYFQADRTYVFEIDPDRDVLINTFEYICGQEVSAQMDNLQEVDTVCHARNGIQVM